MIKKASLNWTAKTLTNMTNGKNLDFSNSIQRGFVWDDKRKSLLIHSMIVGFPIPAFFAAREDGKNYSMLDGKQRSHAIAGYINGDYELDDIPDVQLDDGTILDLNGRFFKELSQEIQDEITGYSLQIHYFEGIEQDEIADMFYRLNNGKPLSAIELTRVKAVSFEKIKELAQHPIFTAALSEKSINKYKNEDIVIKAWAILNMENPSLETSAIRPLIAGMEIEPEQAQDIKTVLDRIMEVYLLLQGEMVNSNEDKQKEFAKIMKKVYTHTHLISLIPITLQSIKDFVPTEDFKTIVKSFYSAKKGASISESYNASSSAGSARADKVKIRLDALERHYNSRATKDTFSHVEKPNSPVYDTVDNSNVDLNDDAIDNLDDMIHDIDIELSACGGDTVAYEMI